MASVADKLSALGKLARAEWIKWAPHYAQFTTCTACDESVYCRSKTGERWLCLDCFDQGR